MQSTRQRILEILQEKNNATVEQLSQALGLTPVTIRHHLDILRGEGLVGPPQVLRRPGPGRPQYTYELTEAANDYFPKNYYTLANMMLEEIHKYLSARELEQVMRAIAGRLAARAPSPERDASPQEIVKTATNFMNANGYVARWETTPEGDYLLHACNCPYQRVAQTHDQVCTIDTNLIRLLVGTPPKRISHMATGDDSCTYLIRVEEIGPVL